MRERSPHSNRQEVGEKGRGEKCSLAHSPTRRGWGAVLCYTVARSAQLRQRAQAAHVDTLTPTTKTKPPLPPSPHLCSITGTLPDAWGRRLSFVRLQTLNLQVWPLVGGRGCWRLQWGVAGMLSVPWDAGGCYCCFACAAPRCVASIAMGPSCRGRHCSWNATSAGPLAPREHKRALSAEHALRPTPPHRCPPRRTTRCTARCRAGTPRGRGPS